MWEAKGDADGLIAWWRDAAAASLPDGVTVELFRAADRVVAKPVGVEELLAVVGGLVRRE